VLAALPFGLCAISIPAYEPTTTDAPPAKAEIAAFTPASNRETPEMSTVMIICQRAALLNARLIVVFATLSILNP
jgi:hypothetical protein